MLEIGEIHQSHLLIVLRQLVKGVFAAAHSTAHHRQVIFQIAHLLLHLDGQQRAVTAVPQDLVQTGAYVVELLGLHTLDRRDERLVGVRLERDGVFAASATNGAQILQIAATLHRGVPLFKNV